MNQITIPITITDQQAADIMCTALEGGIGYWCVSGRIQRTVRAPGDSSWNYISFEAFDNEAPDEGFGIVTYDTIRFGIERILRGEVKIRKDLRAQVLTITDADRTDIDSDAADCIVQAGLFSEIVYG